MQEQLNNTSKTKDLKEPHCSWYHIHSTPLLHSQTRQPCCCASWRTSGSSGTWDPSASSTRTNTSITGKKGKVFKEIKAKLWRDGYPLGGGMPMPAGLLDPILVSLIGLIMRGVVLRFRHSLAQNHQKKTSDINENSTKIG